MTLEDRISLKFVKAEDCSVDDEYHVYLDGKKTDYCIQISSGRYSVNKGEYDVPGDETTLNGVIFYDEEFRSLIAAKRSLLKIMAQEGVK